MDYWKKQTRDKPLFENILWSRPETKHGAGKLLVIGGNSFGFSSVQEAYKSASDAGAGTIRTVLPESLHKILGGLLDNTIFAPSTPSGSFANDALGEFLINSEWSDGVILSGDLGRNSETSILLEKYLDKYDGQLTIAKDSIDYFYNQPKLVLHRLNTCLVLNLSQLQKLGTASNFDTPFLIGMGLVLLVQALHKFTLENESIIITKELDNIVVAYKGMVSSTKIDSREEDAWRTEVGTQASVFWMQSPSKPFESITTSLV